MNPTNPNSKGTAKKGGRRVTVIKFAIVLVLVAAVALICLPLAISRGPAARPLAATTQISIFGTALGAYQIDCGSYPNQQEGLHALMVKPSGATNWRGPYMEKNIPSNPWGKPYVYEMPGRHNTNGYDLYAVGPDGTVFGNWTHKQLTANQTISR